jgi:hypothetical protein
MLKSFLKPPNLISAVGNYGKATLSMAEKKLIAGTLIKLMSLMVYLLLPLNPAAMAYNLMILPVLIQKVEFQNVPLYLEELILVHLSEENTPVLISGMPR